jgi:cyclase
MAKHKVRLIARLDVKAPNLIKGVNLEGVRVVGDPNVQARKYYAGGIDEIIYVDAVATLYARNSLSDLVRATANDVFIPMTVGGGLRSIQDVDTMMRSGADKVSINTAAVQNPDLVREASGIVGCQCIVVAIDAKRSGAGWEVFTHGGRKPTGIDAVQFARDVAALGAGEILLTSMDRDGTKAGFDLELTRAVSDAVTIPVVASGGVGNLDHLVEGITKGHASAVLAASIFHFGTYSIGEAKRHMADAGIAVRPAG